MSFSIPRVSFGAKYAVFNNLTNPGDRTDEDLARHLVCDHNNMSLVCVRPANDKQKPLPSKWLLLNPDEADSFRTRLNAGTEKLDAIKGSFENNLETVEIQYKIGQVPQKKMLVDGFRWVDAPEGMMMDYPQLVTDLNSLAI